MIPPVHLQVSMSSRIKPYEGTPVRWDVILKKTLRIPMNQREYSWDETHHIKFVEDICDIYNEGKYIYKMGSIINYKHDGRNDIYDGQQRTLTTIVLLHCIGLCGTDKLKGKIQELLTFDIDMDDLPEDYQKIKDAYDVKIIPKILCVNPADMKALVAILNNRVDTLDKYRCDTKSCDEFEDDDSCESEELYRCKLCKVTCKNKSEFKKHLKKTHNFIDNSKESMLYGAYECIYEDLQRRGYDDAQTTKLYKFIVGDIDIQWYDCDDPVYVSKIFDWENNRGKEVESLDLIKNPILVKISDDKKHEIYDMWGKLKATTHPNYKEYGPKIFDVAIQLYHGEIHRKMNRHELFRTIVDAKDCYKEVNKFFDIVKRLFALMEDIRKDRYGRLFTEYTGIQLTWEGYMWCLLPICYTKGDLDTALIKLFCKWMFRNIQANTYTFNNLGYSNSFLTISNKYLKDSKFEYLKELESCLRDNMDDSIRQDAYEETLWEKAFTPRNATALLTFLETCETPDIHTVPLTYTLEHVWPKKYKENLSNPAWLNILGNLTLLEGKNSENGHKGNSGVGCKDHGIKVTRAYTGSSSKLTRDIATEYPVVFTQNDMRARCKKIAGALNKYTLY